VVGDLEAVTLGDRVLPTFDILIDELFDVSAIDALDVIVVRPLVQLEHGHTVGEMMTGDQPCRFKLGQHAIHRGKPDILTGIDQATIDVLSR